MWREKGWGGHSGTDFQLEREGERQGLSNSHELVFIPVTSSDSINKLLHFSIILCDSYSSVFQGVVPFSPLFFKVTAV